MDGAPAPPEQGEDGATAEQAVQAVYAAQRAALAAGDLSTLVSLYTEGATLLPPDGPAVGGRGAIEARLRDELGHYAMTATLEALVVRVVGDRALAWGRYALVAAPRDGGSSFSDRGAWLDVLEGDADGSWRIALASWTRSTQLAPPDEITLFDFLIGSWSCDARVTMESSAAQEQHRADWTARYVLEGHAIIDEYREMRPTGELVRFGATLRSYDSERGAWVMRWLDALHATWFDLGPEDLGGVQLENGAITFMHRLPGGELIRATFADISEHRFTWRADRSADGGRSWQEAVMVIHARRAD